MATFVGHSGAKHAASTPLNFPKPVAVLEGNLMVAFVLQAVTGASSAPAGWTTIGSADIEAGANLTLFRKLATASEPASYDFTIAASAQGAIVAYSGVDVGNPINAFAIATTTTVGTTHTDPSITTTKDDCVVVGWFRLNALPTVTPQDSYVTRLDEEAVVGSGVKVVAIDKTVASGVHSPQIVTGTSVTSWRASVALTPPDAVQYISGTKRRLRIFP